MSAVLQSFRDEFATLPAWGKLASGAVALAAPLVMYYFYKKRPRKTPLKEDWKVDVVYLYQFPPGATIPNLSPFALKLETWLRMEKINYEYVPTAMSVRSREGQMPFVELNGVEYCDSQLIIRDLAKYFLKKETLSPEQTGASRAFERMVEDSTSYSYAYIRYNENVDVLLSEKVLGVKLPFFVQLFMPGRMMRSQMLVKLWQHGIGRHPREDIISIGLDDLRAISAYLGNKDFMHGSQPTRVDCTLFGHLSQIVYVPIESPHRDLLEAECANVTQYLNRIKEKLWPDWYQVREKRPVLF